MFDSQKSLVRASPPHMTFGVSSLGFFPEKTALHPFSKSTKHPSRSQYTFGAAVVGLLALTAAAALPEPLIKGAACGLSAMVARMKGITLAHRYIECGCRARREICPEEICDQNHRLRAFFGLAGAV